MNKLTFLDFFSGIGGIRLGLEQAGCQCLGFCEFDKYARQSYKAMYDTADEFESHDVTEIKPEDLPKADLWCFGFPCQDISIAGKQRGIENGERSGLFFEIMRLLNGQKQENKPKWLLAENVKNLLSIGSGFDFLRLLNEMDEAGYDIEWQLLNSKDFGVPQNRERVFIVGHLRGQCGGKVFPICPTDGENSIELLQIGHMANMSRENPQAYRVYSNDGLAPTLNCSQGGGRQPCIVDDTYGFDGIRIYKDVCPTLRSERNGLKVKVIGNYSPSKHNASRIVDSNGIAPTVMENHGTVTAVLVKK